MWSIVEESGRRRCSYSSHAAVMLACKEPRRLKINKWSDTLKLIKCSSRVVLMSVSNHTMYSCHNCFKDGKYLMTSLWQAGKECNTEHGFYFPPVFFIFFDHLLFFTCLIPCFMTDLGFNLALFVNAIWTAFSLYKMVNRQPDVHCREMYCR